jgi:hypothetical protein
MGTGLDRVGNQGLRLGETGGRCTNRFRGVDWRR